MADIDQSTAWRLLEGWTRIRSELGLTPDDLVGRDEIEAVVETLTNLLGTSSEFAPHDRTALTEWERGDECVAKSITPLNAAISFLTEALVHYRRSKEWETEIVETIISERLDQLLRVRDGDEEDE